MYSTNCQVTWKLILALNLLIEQSPGLQWVCKVWKAISHELIIFIIIVFIIFVSLIDFSCDDKSRLRLQTTDKIMLSGTNLPECLVTGWDCYHWRIPCPISLYRTRATCEIIQCAPRKIDNNVLLNWLYKIMKYVSDATFLHILDWFEFAVWMHWWSDI